ncbi:hypothetical protein [Kitasatospora sp. MAP5-34]|uniref:hypothetical protein n=1 Tax=Kitasatospora sp. MAP5-34 TaxID=3035102 RepID=UPI0024742F1F|nr:hypothetical protein [Kitasatospora sp. MAP5-34]MDH6580382.1 hypothetical protein [Kitasatospora sp. MAP5-34]
MNTGEATSNLGEAARRTLLRRLLGAHDPSRTLKALVASTPWNLASTLEWEHVGGAGREVDTFNIGDANDVTACGYSTSVTIRTGFSSTSASPRPLPAIMATVDLQLQLPNDRILTLIELRDLLVDAMAAVPLTWKAANDLLPTGPFEEGELGLWIASNSATGLPDVVDLGPATRSQSPLSEVELYSDLQKWPADPSTTRADPASEAARLAVELLRRCFQRTNREDYERQLNALLP